MKNYLVCVEAEDFIDVEAESEEEAEKKALEIAASGVLEYTATVMNCREQ